MDHRESPQKTTEDLVLALQKSRNWDPDYREALFGSLIMTISAIAADLANRGQVGEAQVHSLLSDFMTIGSRYPDDCEQIIRATFDYFDVTLAIVPRSSLHAQDAPSAVIPHQEERRQELSSAVREIQTCINHERAQEVIPAWRRWFSGKSSAIFETFDTELASAARRRKRR